MKKLGITFLLFLGILSQQAMAQATENKFILADRVVPHLGFVQMFPTITVNEENGFIEDIFINSGTVNFYNFHVGAYTVLTHHKDIVSVGIDNSLQFGIRPNFNNTDIPTGYNIQVPIFAMARVGAGATPYNQQRIGLGVGIGASINHMRFTMLRPNENPNIQSLAVVRTTTYANPAAVVEISYGNLIGRLQLGLGAVRTGATDEVLTTNPNVIDEVEAIHGMFGYGLIYRF